MAQNIILKRSSVAGKVPTTSSLSVGEVAINTYDGKLFIHRSGSTKTIQEVVTTNTTNTGSISLTQTGSFGELVVTQDANLHRDLYVTRDILANGQLDVLGALTASLATGYAWVGNGSNISKVVATSSFTPTGTISSSTQILNYNTFVTTGSNTFVGSQTITGSFLVSGSTTQIGNNTLQGNNYIYGNNTISGSNTLTGSNSMVGANNIFGNTTMSGSIIISGSDSPSNPTIRVYGDMQTDGVIKFDPVNKTIDSAVTASYIYVSGSTNDLYFTQNGPVYKNTTRLRWVEGNLYTGLLNGGIITSQSVTTYQISSGSGLIVTLNASLSDNPYPTIQYLNWQNLSASIAPLSASYDQTYVAIQSNGTIFAQGTPFVDGQYDTMIPIGVVLHQNHSTINGVKTSPSVAYGHTQRASIFTRAFGPLKLSGYVLAPSGSSTGSLVLGSGISYADGANYTTNPESPSYITDSGTTTSKIFRYRNTSSYTDWVYDTNAGAGYGAIDPTRYSANGVLTLVPGTGSNKEWSIQRVYWYPNTATKAFVVFYGNATYADKVTAYANINVESFVEAPNTAANAIYVAAILVQKDADFTDSATYQIVPGGLFRSIGGTGGGGAVTSALLSQLGDTNINGVTDGQPLVYNTSQLKWINSSTLTADLAGNATTATTAATASHVDYSNVVNKPTLISGSSQLTELNTFTGSATIRLNNLETTSASVNISISNLNSTTASAGIRLTNLETTSASVNTSISNINTFTSSNANTSLNTFTSSFNSAIQLTGSNVNIAGNLTVAGTQTTINSTTVSIGDNILNLNGTNVANGGLYVSDPTAPNTGTGSLLWDSTNDYWKGGFVGSEEKLLRAGSDTVVSSSAQIVGILSSLNTFTSSASTRLTNLETTSASVNISITNLNSATSSAGSRITNLETTSASVNSSLSNLNTETASIESRFTTLASVTSSYNSFTSSAGIRLTNLETTSASVNTSITNINTFTASNGNTSLNTYTASATIRLTNLETTSASVNTSVTNLNTYSASVSNSIQQLSSKTGSYATTGSNSFIGNQTISGSLTIGSASVSTENTLIIGPSPAGGSGEGGQILLAASGGLYTSASMLDNWQNQTRLLRGTNAGSDAVVAAWNMGTKQMQLPAYNNASSFTGTATANLAVNSNGDVITVSTTGASVFPYTGNAVITGSLTTTGIIYATPNGGMYFQGGDDAALYDINISNHMGIYGVQDSTVGSVKLGSGGGIISGKNGNIGIGTIEPLSGSLHVNGNIFATSVTGAIAATNGVVSGSSQVIGILSSLNTYTSSATIRLTNLETTSASVNSSVTNLNTFSASNGNTSLNTYTGSNDTTNTTQNNRLTNLETTSASVNISVSNLNAATSSYETKGRGIVSGSSQITYSGISSIPAGIVSSSAQVLGGTGIVSSSAQITPLLPTGVISGSSQLSGTTITNLTITNLTTVNETASVVFSSGSNTFGDFSDDIHRFTGSVQISGSETVVGNITATSFNGTINATNGIVSGSSQIVYTSLSSIPGGIVSSSAQVLGGTGIVSGSGTANYLTKYTGGTSAGNSLIYDTGTLIGIGTTDPSYVLDVQGSGRFTTGLTVTGSVTAASFDGTINATNGVISGSSQLTSSYDTRYALSGSSGGGTTIGAFTGSFTGSFIGDGSGLRGVVSDDLPIDGWDYNSNSSASISEFNNESRKYLIDFQWEEEVGTPVGFKTFISNVTGSSQIVPTEAGIKFIVGNQQVALVGPNGIESVPTAGTVSGSSQITFSGISSLPTLVSGSSQVVYTSLTSIPSGIVSGTAQLTSTFAGLNSANTFVGTQIVSGSTYITGDLVVYGSSSIQNISASSVNIGTNTIELNTNIPSVRFAGLSVHDSGSAMNVTGSLWWDSLTNNWIYQHESGSTYSGGTLISGPKNTGALGSEVGLTTNYLQKAQAYDHLTQSVVYDDGTNIGVGTSTPGYKLDVNGTGNFTSNLTVTGSLNMTGSGTTSPTITPVGTFATNAGNTLNIGGNLQMGDNYLNVQSFFNSAVISNNSYWANIGGSGWANSKSTTYGTSINLDVNGNIRFYTSRASGSVGSLISYNNPFTVFQNGNTTIGDSTISATNNGYNLQVNGNPTASGSLYVNGLTTLTGSAVITGSLTITGLTTLNQTNEVIKLDTGFGAGTRSLDLNSGSIFYLNSLTGSGTWNTINVPTTSQRATTMTFVIEQGATAYSASAYQINSSAVTVKWVGGTTPTGNANKTDVIGLTAFRSGSTWNVLGALQTFG